ncbi:MAG: BrnT family toxin [Deltaproteobacteria bacterium]|nr:BrnT family toxin [Deltaproteobacteria bacterium]
MVDLKAVESFEWDRGNTDKSFKKHGITPREAEEVFLDEQLHVVDDVKHAEKEARFIAVGKTVEEKILFVVFTLRGDKVRIISARKANKKERDVYGKKVKENPKV